MSLEQLIPINVVLGAGAVALPQFGTGLILEELTTQQYGKFVAQSGGLSTLLVTPQSVSSFLTSLGISSGEQAGINVTEYFNGRLIPDNAFLGFRGVADKTHNQTVTVLPELGTSDRASIGQYQLSEVEGGPYTYVSPGVQQVVTLTVDGAGPPGIYEVNDGDGNNYSYASPPGLAGFNVWTLKIISADVGLYELIVSGVSYTYTADALDTITTIRDGLFLNTTDPLAHPPHPTWTGNTVGADDITVTSNDVGVTLVVTTNFGPSADATLIETTPIVAETPAVISAGITAAITGAASPPNRWAPVDGVGSVVITANLLNIGFDLNITSIGPAPAGLVQVLTTDHRESVTDVRGALTVVLDAASHPTFTNTDSGTDAIDLDGVTVGVVIPVTAAGPNGNLLLSESQGVLTIRSAQITNLRVLPDAGLGGLAFEGTYEITSFGLSTVSYVNPAASGKSVTTVRNDIAAALTTAWTGVATIGTASTDIVTVTNVNLGQAFTVVLVSPSSNSGLSQTTPTPSMGIRDDINRAIIDNKDWYFLINASGSAIDITEAAKHMDDIAAEFPRMHFWQSSNDAMKDTPATTGSDEGVDTNATGTLRSKGVWSPVPASTQDTYEGVVSQWVGNNSTLLPGQVQWVATSIQGLTSRTDLTAQEEKNLEDRNVSWSEFVGSLPVDQQHPMQGALAPSGFLIDLQRAADQVRAVYQLLAANFIIGQNIINYTDEGLGEIHNVVVQGGTDVLKDQGLVISDATYNNETGQAPRRADATNSDIQKGIAPLFDFTINIQLGIAVIPIQVTIVQEVA